MADAEHYKKIFEELNKMIEKIKFGEIVIKIHNSKIVEIEKKEKKRFFDN